MEKIPALDFLKSLDTNSSLVVSKMTKTCPIVAETLIEVLYGAAYQRDEISLRERFFVTIAAIIASKDMVPQLAYQTELAMINGIKREELMEVVFQISVFIGFGTALNSMTIINQISRDGKDIPQKPQANTNTEMR